MSAGARIVAGKYRMGETLGKGGYSWVKKGTHVDNGTVVALKFTAKGPKWDAHDQKNIDAELQALDRCTKVDHPNVMKIYEVNQNVDYPTTNGQTTKAILFVLEYASGGELFDVLYYTGCLSDEMARTYFHQLINGIEILHKNGICHRDLKPQNLLLDGNCVLKITDFGLSKIMQTQEDKVMQTQHVGTRGFQSPEQRAKQSYSFPCDMFAAGVILFILLTGYPPFEHAQATDYWFKELMEKNGKPANVKKFWKKHRDAKISDAAKDFIARLLAADPHKRLNIEQCREHPWMQAKKLSQDEIKAQLDSRLKSVVDGRMNDIEKQREQYHSIVNRGPEDPSQLAPDFKDCTFRGFTQFRTTAHANHVFQSMEEWLETGNKGHYNREDGTYVMQGMVATKNQNLEFEMAVYNDYTKDIEVNGQPGERVVVLRRLQGGFIEYGKLYNMILNQVLSPLNLEKV